MSESIMVEDDKTKFVEETLKEENVKEENIKDEVDVKEENVQQVNVKEENVQQINVKEENVKEENVKEENVKEENRENPYAYLNRDFSSENYKIEVRGLPKYYGVGEFKRFLNEKLNLGSNKIKPPKRGGGWVYVCFRNEESREKAIEIINGITWKHSKLSAQAAKAAPDPFIKRKLEEQESMNKKFKADDGEENLSSKDRVQSTTTPLWNMPYPDQLELKQKEMRAVLCKLSQQILNTNKSLTEWLTKQKTLHNGLPCELSPILSADMIEGYRNKCEFTIGKDIDEDKLTIGFRLSSYASGSTAVGPIDHLCHVPERMKSAIKVLEKFICNSKLDIYDVVTQNGYWRQVTARTTRLNHLMLIIGIHPQNLSTEELNNIKTSLKEFFEQEENRVVGVTSLYFQTIDKKGSGGKGGGTIEHVSGTEYIEETILGMTFRISPEAFFQINTLGAEVLYKAAIDLAQPLNNTAVLDVCCGTGTIGLCFSKYCEEVLGIEIIPNAIKDAKQNAENNGVTNCEFFVGKAEEILSPVIQRATKSDIVAIVDPPRAGLHQKALLALRNSKRLKKLVYISCDPKAAIRNLIDFARPNSKQYFGEPLVPVKAVPVDMFPYTRHCELVICLERLSAIQEAENGST